LKAPGGDPSLEPYIDEPYIEETVSKELLSKSVKPLSSLRSGGALHVEFKLTHNP
jgi:hypothetical protein